MMWIAMMAFAAAYGGKALGQNYFEQGSKEYWNENGSLEVAVSLFTKAIQHRQEIAQSYMLRGAARSLLKQYSRAMKDLDSARSLDPANYKVFGFMGRNYREQGDYPNALVYYDKAIGMNGKDADLYDSRATVKMSLGRHKEAIVDENMAIQLDPGNADFYLNRGFAKMQLRDDAASLADYNKSISIHPSAQCYADRGALYLQMKQYQKAIEDFSRELKEMPQDFVILCKRGEAYQALGQASLACQDFNASKALGYAPATEAASRNKCN
jgi:tetratricopeptide (TPR) repeat protein